MIRRPPRSTPVVFAVLFIQRKSRQKTMCGMTEHAIPPQPVLFAAIKAAKIEDMIMSLIVIASHRRILPAKRYIDAVAAVIPKLPTTDRLAHTILKR